MTATMPLLRRTRKPRKPRKRAEHSLAEIERERRKLDRQLQQCRQRLREEPERCAREQAERAVTMPPPDDLVDRERERRFYALATRKQLRNVRRSQAGSVLLFVLLVAATVALMMWMLRIAQPLP